MKKDFRLTPKQKDELLKTAQLPQQMKRPFIEIFESLATDYISNKTPKNKPDLAKKQIEHLLRCIERIERLAASGDPISTAIKFDMLDSFANEIWETEDFVANSHDKFGEMQDNLLQILDRYKSYLTHAAQKRQKQGRRTHDRRYYIFALLNLYIAVGKWPGTGKDHPFQKLIQAFFSHVQDNINDYGPYIRPMINLLPTSTDAAIDHLHPLEHFCILMQWSAETVASLQAKKPKK